MSSTPVVHPLPGTARLRVAVPVAVASFFYTNILEYALPLYFDALRIDNGMWSELVKYKLTAWIAGSALAGLLSRRYGERWVWSFALLGKLIVMLGLIYYPSPRVIILLSAWQGLTGALMWIAAVSLIQMVPDNRKGFSNALVMVSLGVGAIFGALIGRFIIYLGELKPLLSQSDYGGVCSRLFNFTRLTSTPQKEDFLLIFWLLMLTTVVSSVAIALAGQRSGRFERDEPPDWSQTLQDVSRLIHNPKFWALAIPLALLGGPVFQGSNQFLPYRAEDLGLKQGSADQGWIWLQLLKTVMWIPGGAAVGLLAGRRAPGWVAVIMLGSFSLTLLGIGLSSFTWQIFLCVAGFEFARQFMRWSHAGYMSDHMPNHLRATAIGCTIMFSGLGSAVYSWVADGLWDPDAPGFDSSEPVMAAAALGLAGSLGLFAYDLVRPIAAQNISPQKDGVP
ncbi:MAG: hypothetical protein CMJ81_04055 [Planctomycetaceae bacterium]|nr:hypothetical protein [Planctomycetaceae bacterium]